MDKPNSMIVSGGNNVKQTIPVSSEGKKKKKKKNVKAVEALTVDDRKTRALIKSELRNLKSMPKDVPQLSAALAMPKDYLVPRFGGSMGSDPTAIANPWSRTDVTFPLSSAPLPDEMNNDWCPIFVFRDALRFGVYPFVVGGVSPSIYASTFTYKPTQGIETFPRVYPCKWTSGPVLHGPVLYPGRLGNSDQHRGFLLSQGNVLRINTNPSSYPVGSFVLITVKRLSAGQWVPQAEYQDINGGAGTFNYVATATGYYSFTINYSQGGAAFMLPLLPGNFLISAGGSGSTQTCWAQVSLPFYTESYEFIDAVRITGVSLMYTNTASPLNRQGQITGLLVPKGTQWLQYTSFAQVAQDKKSVTRDIVEGAYGFLKPTSVDDFNMRVYELPGDTVSNTDEDLVFQLYPESDYLCLIANVNIDAGQSAYMTMAASVEYTTLNQWISVKQGVLSDIEIKEALEVFSHIPQWHTNDLHWDDIWSWVKDTAKDIWSGIKEIAPIAAAAIPLIL